MSIPIHKLQVSRHIVRGQESTADFEIHDWTWRSIAAIACLAGGTVAPLIGVLLIVPTWVTGHENGYGLFLHRFGTVFLFLTMPLIVAGAHLLDVHERRWRRVEK